MNTTVFSSIKFTAQVRPLCTGQHHTRRAMRRCSVLAGISPLRPRALPGTPIMALAGAFNCRF
jgi:hypothetical protein